MDDATRDLSADDAAAAIGRLTSELEWMTRDRDRLRAAWEELHKEIEILAKARVSLVSVARVKWACAMALDVANQPTRPVA
jgi:hypothetical protein